MGLAPHPARGQAASGNPDAWTLPRTAAGHPYLQGVWASRSATPLERPASLADRELLTDEEVAELQRRCGPPVQQRPERPLPRATDLFLAVLGDAEQYDYPRSTCGALAMRRARNSTTGRSLIIDPHSNGRLPPRTRRGGAAAGRRHVAMEMSAGRPRRPVHLGALPDARPAAAGRARRVAGIYGYYQIFQTADHVALVMETIHDRAHHSDSTAVRRLPYRHSSVRMETRAATHGKAGHPGGRPDRQFLVSPSDRR